MVPVASCPPSAGGRQTSSSWETGVSAQGFSAHQPRSDRSDLSRLLMDLIVPQPPLPFIPAAGTWFGCSSGSPLPGGGARAHELTLHASCAALLLLGCTEKEPQAHWKPQELEVELPAPRQLPESGPGHPAGRGSLGAGAAGDRPGPCPARRGVSAAAASPPGGPGGGGRGGAAEAGSRGAAAPGPLGGALPTPPEVAVELPRSCLRVPGRGGHRHRPHSPVAPRTSPTGVHSSHLLGIWFRQTLRGSQIKDPGKMG